MDGSFQIMLAAFHPNSLATTSAICLQYFSVTAVLGPSTITRHMFCVPE
jgi:hypothetical protein